MTYDSLQNMIDRFGEEELIELSDRSNTGAIDTNVMAQVLGDADTEIDGYLSGVFALPLVGVPDRLIKLAADIARYELYGARCTEQVRQRYTDAIRDLKLVQAGTLSLGLDPVNQPVPEAGGVGMKPKRQVFSSHTLRDYDHPPFF